MKSSKILTLAIMASLLSSPCAWAAHKTGAAADAKPAAQTETVKPAKAEKTAAATEMAAETAAEPLPADSYSAAKVVSGEKTALADSYAALVADESALLVKNGAEVTLSHGAITKSGATTDVLGSKFHGQNAAVLAADGALSMDGCTIRTEADGANAVFATGAKGSVKLHDSNIRTTGASSRGLDATEGGKITADNINIGTAGIRSAALATEPSGASVTVSKSTINTSGEGSPLIYSKGSIKVSEAKGTAGASEIAVVEGNNAIHLEYVDLSGNGTHGVMLYQNKSRDNGADGKGLGRFSAKGSALRSLKEGPLFYVTNTAARIYSEMTTMQYLGGTLIRVEANQFGDAGSNGGDLTFMANNQGLYGNVSADGSSTIMMDLQNGSHWSGAINTDNSAKKIDVNLDASSSWSLTADCHVDGFTDGTTALTNLKGNGHTLFYNSSNAANAWLGGKTYELQGGGYLKPNK
ncbi:hypothetical protein [Acidaminococcus fermentans]|uniref:hypothetical protein n=1 Tax=Acidaminococcus fermentans TaxID=905 RepID=UPI003F896DFF